MSLVWAMAKEDGSRLHADGPRARGEGSGEHCRRARLDSPMAGRQWERGLGKVKNRLGLGKFLPDKGFYRRSQSIQPEHAKRAVVHHRRGRRGVL